jgi:uncharacterized coiled-coil DUF342 family protein
MTPKIDRIKQRIEFVISAHDCGNDDDFAFESKHTLELLDELRPHLRTERDELNEKIVKLLINYRESANPNMSVGSELLELLKQLQELK